jgi:hypothetical protein
VYVQGEKVRPLDLVKSLGNAHMEKSSADVKQTIMSPDRKGRGDGH